MNIKRKFLQLVSACKKDEELFDFIAMGMNAMVNYVGKVAHMEYCIPLYNARYEGQKFRDKIQELDERRRMAHESAISAVNSLTRLAKHLGVEPMFDGDPEDRYQIADFCEAMVHEFFVNRSGVPTHKLEEYIEIANTSLER